MNTIDRLADICAAGADKCVQATGELVGKGKKRIDIIAAENKLAKAERQLGALVYSLHKTGEKNSLLVKRYIDSIEKLDNELSSLTGESVHYTAKTIKCCPACGAEVREDALFCNGCGGKL
ncbi:MAG: zinc ribbon domain-containing protein [Oscillospiraceae bacterium]